MSTTLRLDQIRIDGGTQPRASINEDVVKDYADTVANGGDLPPVTVYHDGATHWLADGFHRWLAHRKTYGPDGTIEADIRQGTRRDAILHAVASNATHGLRRTNDDKHKAVTTLLEDDEWKQWSDREIARQCNVSPHLVASIRDALTVQTHSGDDAPETTTSTRKGADGRSQAASKPDVAQVWEIENAIRELLNDSNRGGHQAVVSLSAGWPDTKAIQSRVFKQTKVAKTVRQNLAKQARANVRQHIQEALDAQAQPAEAPKSARGLEMALRNYFNQHYTDPHTNLEAAKAAANGTAGDIREAAKRYLREMGHLFDEATFQAALEDRARIQADYTKRQAKAETPTKDDSTISWLIYASPSDPTFLAKLEVASITDLEAALDQINPKGDGRRRDLVRSRIGDLKAQAADRAEASATLRPGIDPPPTVFTQGTYDASELGIDFQELRKATCPDKISNGRDKALGPKAKPFSVPAPLHVMGYPYLGISWASRGLDPFDTFTLQLLYSASEGVPQELLEANGNHYAGVHVEHRGRVYVMGWKSQRITVKARRPTAEEIDRANGFDGTSDIPYQGDTWTMPGQPEEPTAAPAPTAAPDRSASIVASQKAYIERLEKQNRELRERMDQLENAEKLEILADQLSLGNGSVEDRLNRLNGKLQATERERDALKANVSNLVQRVEELESQLEQTVNERDDLEGQAETSTPAEDLDGWLPPLTYPERILAINAALDDTTPGPRDPDHSLANRVDSYCASLARATRDLEGLTSEKLIELIYSPAERAKGRPATLRQFLQAADNLRRANHEYATNPPTLEPAA